MSQSLTLQLLHTGCLRNEQTLFANTSGVGRCKAPRLRCTARLRIFSMGFRSHGIKRNTHTSWKRVRVLPQTNMLEAVITAFHCRRKPSFVAPTVFVSTHRTKRGPTCLSYCWRRFYQLLLTAFGYRRAAGIFICRKVCFSWMFAVPHLSYKAHSRHGATLNTQPGNFPQSSCVLPSPQISTLGRSRSWPYSPPPPPSSTADVRHLPLSL